MVPGNWKKLEDVLQEAQRLASNAGADFYASHFVSSAPDVAALKAAAAACAAVFRRPPAPPRSLAAAASEPAPAGPPADASVASEGSDGGGWVLTDEWAARLARSLPAPKRARSAKSKQSQLERKRRATQRKKAAKAAALAAATQPPLQPESEAIPVSGQADNL